MNKKDFTTACSESVRDVNRRSEQRENYKNYLSRLHNIAGLYPLEELKIKAARIRFNTINKLDRYLTEFEENFIKSGGRVIWALNHEDAAIEISELIKNSSNNIVICDHEKILSEAGVNEIIYKAYSSKVISYKNQSSEKAEIFICACDFIVADTASVVFKEREQRFSDNIHNAERIIILAGIEQIVSQLRELEILLFMHTAGSHKRKGRANEDLIFELENNAVRNKEVYIVLLDNGRSDLLDDKVLRESLHCIKCEACSLVCPVNISIGTEEHQCVFASPIDSITNPYRKNIQDKRHLSFASTLCGACQEVCPVKIKLTDLLIYSRTKIVKEGKDLKRMRLAMSMFAFSLRKPKLLEKTPAFVSNIVLKGLSSSQLPPVSKESFRKSWMRLRGKE